MTSSEIQFRAVLDRKTPRKRKTEFFFTAKPDGVKHSFCGELTGATV